MKFYEVKVSFWEEALNEEATDTGLVVGSSYADAMNRIMDEYGEKLTEVNIQETIFDNLYPINEDTYNDFAYKED